MRINTNVAALNSYNQLKNTQNNLSKSLSRLSSGKRINGAADDAAGLAISEKMGSQTRGLAQAQRNAQDGISMIQTAEGALKESHSILQRMRELSVQSANDTNTQADRAEIQKEVDQLASELTRIGETTEFNTQKLLDGTLDNTKFQIGANEGQNMNIAINDMRAEELGVSGDGNGDATFEINAAAGYAADGVSDKVLNSGDNTLKVVEFGEAKSVEGNDTFFGLQNESGEIVAVSGKDTNAANEGKAGYTYNFLKEGVSLENLETNGALQGSFDVDNSTDTNSSIDFNEAVKTGEVTIEDVSIDSGDNLVDSAIAEANITASGSVETDGIETGDYTIKDGTNLDDYDNIDTSTWSTDNDNDIDLVDLVDKVVVNDNNEVVAMSFDNTVTDSDNGNAITVDDGSGNIATPGQYWNMEDLSFDAAAVDTSVDSAQSYSVIDSDADKAMETTNLAVDDKVSIEASGGIDVSSQEAANNAISTLDDAIASVSGERSKLGAVQNRLDHTINNLNTAEENLTAAESRISDVDMAKEMMNMSKQQILSQAGTAMMAQANQLPQGVLQLLG